LEACSASIVLFIYQPYAIGAAKRNWSSWESLFLSGDQI